ncbi:hypothetical protein PFISCL1PPCAC_27697, partial [Pristionchus fissidentatus]
MDDDLDMLGNLDDLDSALFGRKVGGGTAKSTTAPKSALDSLFSDSSTPARRPTTSTAKTKNTVSFLDEVTGDAPSKTSGASLDDLFNESVSSRPTTSSGGG